MKSAIFFHYFGIRHLFTYFKGMRGNSVENVFAACLYCKLFIGEQSEIKVENLALENGKICYNPLWINTFFEI